MKVYKNLVHIGYAKAGSSFLQNWFQQNPDFVYVENAIVGFTNINNLFSYIYENDLMQIKEKRKKDCLQKQTFFVSSHEEIAFWQGPPQTKVIGIELRPYPIKAHQKQVAQYFKQLLSTPKILVITRGFESMILSAYSQYVKVGGRLTLKGFTTQYEKLMLDFWDYDYIINLYSELFGKENIIVLLVGVWFESWFITRHYHRCLRCFLLLLCQIFLNGKGILYWSSCCLPSAFMVTSIDILLSNSAKPKSIMTGLSFPSCVFVIMILFQ